MKKMVKYDNWCIDRSLCGKSTKIIVTLYRVQAYQVRIVNILKFKMTAT